MVRKMKTWAKQLESALPNAEADALDEIREEFCPHHFFKNAPEVPYDGMFVDQKDCMDCWNSCDSECRHREKRW